MGRGNRADRGAIPRSSTRIDQQPGLAAFSILVKELRGIAPVGHERPVACHVFLACLPAAGRAERDGEAGISSEHNITSDSPYCQKPNRALWYPELISS